jgi:hypothetical protein
VVSTSGAFPVAATATFDVCPLFDVFIVGAMTPDVYADAEMLTAEVTAFAQPIPCLCLAAAVSGYQAQ